MGLPCPDTLGRVGEPLDSKVQSGDTVEVVDVYDREIHGVSITFKLPSVIRLLRYINSPAFGLRVEISSFSHAIMMLGYQRLKRWLAPLLDGTIRSAFARRGRPSASAASSSAAI